MLTVGEVFPRYRARACCGLTLNDLKDIDNEFHAGKWAVYVFYPRDFTQLCPTELIEFAKRHRDFAQRDTLILAGSTDNEYCHLNWRLQHPDLKSLPFPLLAAGRLARELGILEQNLEVCHRATFIVDPLGIVQWVNVCPQSVGRSVAETLRVLEAIQSDQQCPCNWKSGEPFLTL